MRRPAFLRTARHILAREGSAGFFRGLGPCFLRAFPVNASALFVYEGTMRILGAEQVFRPSHLNSSSFNLTALTDTQLEFRLSATQLTKL